MTKPIYNFKGGEQWFTFQCGDCGKILGENDTECPRCGVIESGIDVYAKIPINIQKA